MKRRAPITPEAASPYFYRDASLYAIRLGVAGRVRLVPEGVGHHLLPRRRNLRRSWQLNLTPGWGGRRWKFPFAIKAPDEAVRVHKSLILFLTFAPVVPTMLRPCGLRLAQSAAQAGRSVSGEAGAERKRRRASEGCCAEARRAKADLTIFASRTTATGALTRRAVGNLLLDHPQATGVARPQVGLQTGGLAGFLPTVSLLYTTMLVALCSSPQKRYGLSRSFVAPAEGRREPGRGEARRGPVSAHAGNRRSSVAGRMHPAETARDRHCQRLVH
jgi:hypothetical protein